MRRIEAIRAAEAAKRAQRGLASDRQRALILRLCNEIGLTQDERRELAGFICATDTPSLAKLTIHQARRLIDALTGFQAIFALLSGRNAQ